MSIIKQLPNCARILLQQHLKPWAFSRGEIFHFEGDSITHVRFIERGVIGAYYRHDNRRTVVELVGLEGYIGVPLVLYSEVAAADLVALTDGAGTEIEGTRLQSIMVDNLYVRKLLLEYVRCAWLQTADTLLARCHASVDVRVARLLLMFQDRWLSSLIPLTQERIAELLGIRRASVTEVIARLQTADMLEKRGNGYLRILDRPGLIAFSNPYYRRVASPIPVSTHQPV